MSYDPSYGSELPPSLPDTRDTRSRVQGPAISLIVVGVLNLFMAAGPGMYGLGVSKVTTAELEAELQKSNPKALKDLEAQGWSITDVRNMLVYGSFSWAGLDFWASFLVVLGGIRMLSLKNYGLAVFAAILALLPVVSCSGCCGLGQIAGIWALIVLLNGEVRAAFG